MQHKVLQIENLSKSYGKRRIIDNLSLEVEAGQVYGFLGVNGAGKTTTIKMILGLIKMDEGKIYINGIDAATKHSEAMERVGGIVESPDLYDYLSGLDNLRLFARIRKVDKERINEVVKLVGLEERIKDKVKDYSLGMKQRLGIAVSILHKPNLLILDEPTNGLDPEGIKELRTFLKDLAHKENVAIFVSSHLLSEMQLMCDKVAFIHNGKIAKYDDVKNITTNKHNVYEIEVDDIHLGYNILNKIAKCEISGKLLIVEYESNISNLIKKLLEKNMEVLSWNKKENTLEEEFFNVIGEESK